MESFLPILVIFRERGAELMPKTRREIMLPSVGSADYTHIAAPSRGNLSCVYRWSLGRVFDSAMMVVLKFEVVVEGFQAFDLRFAFTMPRFHVCACDCECVCVCVIACVIACVIVCVCV